jgi:hypothetical protein
MNRTSIWEHALADYLAGQREAIFKWGSNDCALFTAGAVAAMTGTDPLGSVRGKWRSQAGAGRAIRQAGFASIEDWVSSLFDPVEPVFVQRGDIVMIDGALGICIGKDAVFLAEEAPGLNRRPIAHCARAWRVPFGG